MKLEELDDGADFSPVSHPHRKLKKLWAIGDGAIAVLTETLGLLCLRGDMEVSPLPKQIKSEPENESGN